VGISATEASMGMVGTISKTGTTKENGKTVCTMESVFFAFMTGVNIPVNSRMV